MVHTEAVYKNFNSHAAALSGHYVLGSLAEHRQLLISKGWAEKRWAKKTGLLGWAKKRWAKKTGEKVGVG